MRAVEYFKEGFSCSESMIKWAIDEGLASKELLPVATSFSGGMGNGCLCGAIAGAQMIIGAQFGRDNLFGNEIIARAKAKEFVQKFKEKYSATCCRVLTKDFGITSQERKAHCANMVAECEKLVNELIQNKVIK